jgi:hypothetical protein
MKFSPAYNLYRRKRIATTLVLLAAYLAPAIASAETVNDEGLWVALFSQGNLHENECSCHTVKWWFDGQLRFLDDTDGFHQSLIRPGVGVTLNDNVTLWAGYAWIHTEPVTGQAFDENRLWQQATWSHDVHGVTLALRSRLEQRWVETGDDVGLRFRQQVRLNHDLPALPGLSLVAWDEIFFHLNDTDWGAEAGFDQNRAFAGFGWKHTPESRLRTEIGYLHQMIDNASSPDRSHHLLSINFFH